jgi:hypothetical protein
LFAGDAFPAQVRHRGHKNILRLLAL